jgi:hypothetical protein
MKHALLSQGARFSRICEVYAPLIHAVKLQAEAALK